MKTIRLLLCLLRIAHPEQLADERDRAEDRHALLAAGELVRDQPAEHDDAAVLDQHVGGDRALVGDEVDRAGRVRRDVRGFLLDLEDDGVAFADLRRDLEDVADFLALDRLERIHAAAPGCPVLA